MSGVSSYEVIIVGGGPAGATAGYVLAKNRVRTILIEKSFLPREKLCAGLITLKTARLTERVFGDSVSVLKEKGIIKKECQGYRVLAPARRITERYDANMPFYLIEREVYDHHLIKRAVDAGCELIEGERVISLDPVSMEIETSSGRRLKGRFIIGADGVNSRIRRQFPVDLFGRSEWASNVAPTHQITIPLERLNPLPDVPTLYFGFLRHGYGWVFPGIDSVKIGLAGLKRENRENILDIFRGFLGYLGITGEIRIKSWIVPYGSYLPHPAFKNILLVGDAAGFADPLMGEGIYYAQRSGELSAEAILECINTGNKDVEDIYCKKIKDHILPEMKYAGLIRRFLFAILSKFNWYPLSISMALLGIRPLEAIHGIRSYRFLLKKPL